MKVVVCFVVIIGILLGFSLSGCKSVESTNPGMTEEELRALTLPKSLKGYELYSWFADGDWWFTLVAGTNRLKTKEEIISLESSSSKVTIHGIPLLKIALGQLPKNENIFWITGSWLKQMGQDDMDLFVLPQDYILNEIKDLCQNLQLLLDIL